MSNSRIVLELDRETVEFLDKSGEDAQVLLLQFVQHAGATGGRDKAQKFVDAIENWRKIRAAIKDAGVERD